MEFIYSRNEIWNKYPRANILVTYWSYLIAISNYAIYFINIIYFYAKKENCATRSEIIIIWGMICLIFAIMFCCVSNNLVNKFTLMPNRLYDIKFYFLNFTIAYLFSFVNIYITSCYYSESSKIEMCKDIQLCKDNYILFIVSTNLYFLWMNSILAHILVTWLLHNIQKNNTNLSNLRVLQLGEQETECVICFEPLQPSVDLTLCVVKTPCNHYFHNNCLFEWIQINNTCPVCRINFADIV
jgi:hypothetical protein